MSGPDPQRAPAGARRRKPSSYVGLVLEEVLAERRQSQSQLAAALDQHQTYVNKVITGSKTASPEWLDLVADTLGLDAERRRALHVAGAKDKGFRLDLTTED